MKGYKVFNNDLTCRGMQYEVGKEYVYDGKPIPCRQGFHFCETIADCYECYPMSGDTRICEVEATGEIAKDGAKRVTNVIKILAEITCDNLRKGNTGAKTVRVKDGMTKTVSGLSWKVRTRNDRE